MQIVIFICTCYNFLWKLHFAGCGVVRIFSMKSIKFKIFISNLGIVIGMFLIFGVIFLKINIDQARDTAFSSAKASLSQASTYLAEKTASIRNDVDSIALNQQVIDILNIDNSEKYRDIVKWNIDYSRISEMVIKTLNNSDIDTLLIATENDIAKVMNTPILFDISSFRNTEWYDEWVDNPGSYLWHSSFETEHGPEPYEEYVCFTRNLLYSYYNYRTVYVGFIRKEVFDNLLNINALDEHTSFFIMNSKGEILSGTKNLPSGYMDDILGKITERIDFWSDNMYLQSEKLNGHEFIFGIKQIPNTNLYLTYIFSITGMTTDMVITSARNIFLIMLIILPVVLFLSLAVAYSLTKRLDRLKENMTHASEGDFDIDIIQSSQDDEIGVLTKHFNYMLTKISILMDSQYALGKRIKELELKSLQAQINPHFLYNTLDLIKWRANEYNDTETEELVAALSNYYKRSLGRGRDMVPLKDEIDHIESYVYIQNMRFDNCVKLTVEIPDSLKNCLLPRITLQPIVENAIIHGILEKNDESGTINIRAEDRNNELYIYITDDGVGMEQEKADILLSENDTMNITGSGYGLKNIDERIKLSFGEAYGISFSSHPGKGTTVIVRIPIKILGNGTK